MTGEPPSLRDMLAALPKIDLHRHLEGSLRLDTMVEIAKKDGVDLPSWDPEELRPYVQVVDDPPDFLGFLAKFRMLRRFFSTRDAIVRIAYESVADAAQDNIKYLELRFNPIALTKIQGFNQEDAIQWVLTAVDQAQQDYDIKVRLIAQIGRDENLDVAQHIVELAVSFQDQGLVGIDLAGDEIGYPATRFANILQWARQKGMFVTIHAGEVGPATNILEAIDLLGADRIGHGVRAREDPVVIETLVRRQIPLEMCPTSNLQTGTIPTLNSHPLRDYQQAGVCVTINTDDPGISNTTLTDEYLVSMQEIGLSPSELRRAIITAAGAAFLPVNERKQLVSWITETVPLRWFEKSYS